MDSAATLERYGTISLGLDHMREMLRQGRLLDPVASVDGAVPLGLWVETIPPEYRAVIRGLLGSEIVPTLLPRFQRQMMSAALLDQLLREIHWRLLRRLDELGGRAYLDGFFRDALLRRG